MKYRHQISRAPFGTQLGLGPGKIAIYSSNYATIDERVSPKRHAFRHYVDGIFMGYKWQCVELARRYLYLTKGYIFDDVAMAYDIFRLKSVRSTQDGKVLPLKSFNNGALRPPEPGALLIWNEGGEFRVTGHVAIVTEITSNAIRIIEQNVDDAIWPEGQNYSRELKLTRCANGGYWVTCTFLDTSILGWVLQTEEKLYSMVEPRSKPKLFKPQMRRIPVPPDTLPGPLPANALELAYAETMGGVLALSDQPQDRDCFIALSETAHREIKHATNELHAMFMHATDFVLENDALLKKFNLPPALWPRIHRSWDNRRNEMITGRFDFAVTEQGIKVYEYNSDSASCHLECGWIQSRWADHLHCAVGRSAGEHLFESLVHAWERVELTPLLHIMQDRNEEETYHALYMKLAMERAGLACKILQGVEDLAWDHQGYVIDAEGVEVKWVWKTWAWETALDKLREELGDSDVLLCEPLADKLKRRPGLADVLLREGVMVFEPLWTLIPSNKAILPVLWQLYPDHPYLLESYFELTEDLRTKGYVVKPIVGRCGANISLYDRKDNLIASTHGQFAHHDNIYQELFALPKIGDRHIQIGAFTAAGTLAGLCARVDSSPVIRSDSDFLALRVVTDEEFSKGLEQEII